jgi:transcriptional regulator with XRE-family HTH domain
VGGTTHDQLYDAFGAYVRSQRHLAKLTLRQVADLARISNPYLSQIEHGLVVPSIAVLSALADALSVSAETMLLRAAGIVRPSTTERLNQTEHAIRHDSRLDTGQQHALLAVLASFVASSPGAPAHPAVSGTDDTAPSDAVAGQALSGQALSDQALSDQAASDQALSDQAPSDLAASHQAPSDQALFDKSRPGPAGHDDAFVKDDVVHDARVRDHAVHADGGQSVVRRGPLTSMSARPAAAGRAADPRRQGV